MVPLQSGSSSQLSRACCFSVAKILTVLLLGDVFELEEAAANAIAGDGTDQCVRA